jgi:type I restriction enzyme S subunit
VELRAGYKQTEAGLLPEDWEVVPLGDLVKVTSGASPSLFRFTGTGMPYFKVEQLSNAEKYLDATDTPYLFVGGDAVPENSVLFAKRGAAIALNKVRILKQPSLMDTNLMALTPHGGLECEYLFYALGHIGLWRFADTTSVPQINNKHVKPLSFPLPCPHEQHAIATALRDVDALVGGLDRLIAKKRDLKQAAMQQLLTGQTRLPGFDGEWEVKQLGKVLRFQVGFPFSSAFFNEKQQGLRLVKNRDLKSDDQIVYYSGKYDETFFVSDGDILVGMDGDFVPCRWVKGGALLNQRVGRVVPRSGLDGVFAYYFLIEPLKEIEAATASTTVKHLSHGDVEGIEKAIPEVAEQSAIASVLSDMDAELLALEARRDKIRALKQAMMQELLTGRTRLV